MPPWLWAAIGGAVLTAIAAARAWLRRRALERRVVAADARADRAELERDAAGGRAVVAEAQAEVLEDHVETQAAGAAVAEEVRDAASAAGPAPADRIAAVDAWVRSHAGDQGPVPGGDPAPAMPRRR